MAKSIQKTNEKAELVKCSKEIYESLLTDIKEKNKRLHDSLDEIQLGTL
jgi:hypothetical protein